MSEKELNSILMLNLLCVLNKKSKPDCKSTEIFKKYLLNKLKKFLNYDKNLGTRIEIKEFSKEFSN